MKLVSESHTPFDVIFVDVNTRTHELKSERQEDRKEGKQKDRMKERAKEKSKNKLNSICLPALISCC